MPLKRNSGGSGVPLDGTHPLNFLDPLYEKEGSTFLRSGYIETNVSLYPNAYVNYGETGITQVTLNTSSTTDIVFDGTYEWQLSEGTGDRFIRQADSGGVATGLTINTSGQSLDQQSICEDGADLWTLDRTSRIAYKYTKAGAYSGVSLDFSATVSLGSRIEFAEGRFIIADQTAMEVYRFEANGTPVDSFSITGLTTFIASMRFDGSLLWLGDKDISIDYTTSGVRQSEIRFIPTPTSPTYAFIKNNLFWFGNASMNYEYSYFVGMNEEKIDSDTDLTIYIRVA